MNVNILRIVPNSHFELFAFNDLPDQEVDKQYEVIHYKDEEGKGVKGLIDVLNQNKSMIESIRKSIFYTNVEGKIDYFVFVTLKEG